jgi:hypothetical protein
VGNPFFEKKLLGLFRVTDNDARNRRIPGILDAEAHDFDSGHAQHLHQGSQGADPVLQHYRKLFHRRTVICRLCCHADRILPIPARQGKRDCSGVADAIRHGWTDHAFSVTC